MKNKIIFFTRVPMVGTTKTRLYDFVSPENAVEIQKKLMKLNYSILKESGEEVVVYHDGQNSDDNTMKDILENREFSYQEGKTLGDKMYNAIEAELDFNSDIWPIMLGVQFGLAQADNIKRSNATKDGIHGTLKAGRCANRAPRGYKNVRVSKHETHVEIDSKWANNQFCFHL